jgi:hypothetical protein
MTRDALLSELRALPLRERVALCEAVIAEADPIDPDLVAEWERRADAVDAGQDGARPWATVLAETRARYRT